MTPKQLHLASQRLLQLVEFGQLQPEERLNCLRNALEYEQRAAEILRELPDAEPTRSMLISSAASLAQRLRKELRGNVPVSD